MRLARLGPTGSEIPVVLADGVRYDLRPLTADITGEFLGSGGLSRVAEAMADGSLTPLEGAASMRVGAPISRPGKIVCIGLNYRDHADAALAYTPDWGPLFFLKDPSTIIGPYDTVLIPRNSTKTDWEIELGVVIADKVRYLDDPADARRHIAGFVVSHDVAEREFQLERGGQWDM